MAVPTGMLGDHIRDANAGDSRGSKTKARHWHF